MPEHQIIFWPKSYNPESLKSDTPNEGLIIGRDGIVSCYADYQGHIISEDGIEWNIPNITEPRLPHEPLNENFDYYVACRILKTKVLQPKDFEDPIVLISKVKSVLEDLNWFEVEWFEDGDKYWRKVNAT